MNIDEIQGLLESWTSFWSMDVRASNHGYMVLVNVPSMQWHGHGDSLDDALMNVYIHIEEDIRGLEKQRFDI